MTTFTDSQRTMMVSQQVRTSDVFDPAVLKVLADMPREEFVASEYRSLAYADTSIPLAAGRQTLTPQIEGRLLQSLDLSQHDRVLEIGTGSGFVTACLCRLAHQVTSMDVNRELVARAGEKLSKLGVTNCEFLIGDISELEENRDFDAIAVLGSVPDYDTRFQERLTLGGRLFLIVGRAPLMEALVVRRTGAQEWSHQSLFETVIPPLANVPKISEFTF